MNRYVEFRDGAGLIRLEAVMPGVIRCVHTMEGRVAPPSALVDGNGVPRDMSDCFSIERKGADVALRAGSLRVCWDSEMRRLAWTDAATGELLLQEDGHGLAPVDVVRYTTGGEAPVVDKVKTVDGERSFIRNLKPVKDRQAWRGTLRLRFAPGEGIHGFGQGEEGV